MKESIVHGHIGPRDVKSLNIQAAQVTLRDIAVLRTMGIGFDDDDLAEMSEGLGFDAAPDLNPTVYGANIGVPLQFLQTILPGFVRTVTVPRTIDTLVGVTTVGSWEDDEIVQGVLEPTGLAQPYNDYNNIPLASYNNAWDRRNIVRFEAGARVGKLEERRAAKGRINAMAEKRNGAANALDYMRNRVGFYGYNAGANRTYGFLNDPLLPAYQSVTGASWNTATFLVITAQLRTMFAGLRSSSGTIIDPKTAQITVAVAANKIDYLSVTSDFGNSVWDWIKENYPNVRFIAVPELTGANGGADVMYIYAENVSDGSTDGGNTFKQIVPARFQTIGVEQNAKSMVEDYSNATAGTWLFRPWAVRRWTGI